VSIHHTTRLSSSVDAVVDLLCSETFNVDIQQSRDDVVEARYERTGDDDGELSWDMFLTSYKRTRTGGLDRSATQRSITRYRFEKAPRALHWRHIGEEGGKVDIHGVTRVAPDGPGARIERDVTIDVRIPLVGRGIARIIEREFEKSLGPLSEGIKRRLGE